MNLLKPASTLLVASLLLLCATQRAAADSQSAGWDELVSIYYRLEVANYCGLANQQAIVGFTLQRDKLLTDHTFTPELIDSARAAAWKAGYKEWDNRGLGGFKRWCRNEGAAYAAGFAEAATAE